MPAPTVIKLQAETSRGRQQENSGTLRPSFSSRGTPVPNRRGKFLPPPLDRTLNGPSKQSFQALVATKTFPILIICTNENNQRKRLTFTRQTMPLRHFAVFSSSPFCFFFGGAGAAAAGRCIDFAAALLATALGCADPELDAASPSAGALP